MKVSKNVDIIGLVEGLAWIPTNHKNIKSKEAYNKNFILAVNRTRSILFVFPGELSPDMQRVEYNIPTRTLKKTGKAVKIRYFSEIWEGIETLYNHNFDNAIIYANQINNPSIFAIKNKTGNIISEQGII